MPLMRVAAALNNEQTSKTPGKILNNPVCCDILAFVINCRIFGSYSDESLEFDSMNSKNSIFAAEYIQSCLYFHGQKQ